MKTIDYYLNQPEGQTYDKKNGRILPGRVRLNNMRTTHFSRNPKIAAFMKEYEFIREFGEGVDRMYRELEEGGWPKPVFKQDDFMLRASMSAIAFASKKPDDVTENALKNALKTEAEILSLIMEKPSISLDDMASAIQVSRRTVANKIKALQEQRIVIRIGPAKGGQWSVDKENLIHYFAK